ncbi:uncharacterized protein BXIN_0864 [Babesia sp. Xinjiang]|uniref:uncharacterized protein n=1 Tax=Babesia sp. Xinjiang TaxID=462227 RepID=UPI000A2638F9|nr:uncharacterized protein BXIN_0864 [Babesia sp. Xinjiang]ORM41235.1 hypothetical protein BXIN_0864 [Babesia sp. Xinjiang]
MMMVTNPVPLGNGVLLQPSVLTSKHMVIEIRCGDMKMNEYTCQKLLYKVKGTCRVSGIRPNGLITYRDCKQLLSDSDYIANIDSRFKCILVRLYPVSAIILHDSVLVVANGDMNLDAFLRTLCDITREYHVHNPSQTCASSSCKKGAEESETSIDLTLPFEVKILECCYTAALAHLEEDMTAIEEKFKLVEQMVMEKRTYHEINMVLHNLKQPVVNLSEILKGFTEMMDEFLNDEDAMKLLEFDSHMLFYGPETQHSDFVCFFDCS